MNIRIVCAFVIASLTTTAGFMGCSSGTESVPLPVYDSSTPIMRPHRDAGTPDVYPVYDSSDASDECYVWGYPCSDGNAWDFDVHYPEGGGPVNTDAGVTRGYVTTSLTVAGSVDAGLAPEGGISQAGIGDLVASEIASGALPLDTAGIYYVLTSKEVPVDTYGFCGYYCGWHLSEPYPLEGGTQTIRYAFTGDVQACPTVCSTFMDGGPSPNGELSADGMVSIIGHELAEATTDPDPLTDTAWRDSWGYEVGDKCAWSFGDVYTQPSGALYNVGVGSRFFLIQQMWALNANDGGTDHCTLSVSGNPGFDLADAGMAGTWPGPSNSNEVFPMNFWGGPTLNQPIHVYWIWYGEWSNRAKVEPILTDFVNSLGSSPWWASVAEFFDEPSLLDGGADAKAD